MEKHKYPNKKGPTEPHRSISLVIRARNERDNLAHLLELIEDQTIQPQIVVVDNQSTDQTRQLAVAHNATVVDIGDDFNYPKASNLGVNYADGELIVMMSAHSFPIQNEWLANGERHFEGERVAGVYCRPMARRDTTHTERVGSHIAEQILKRQDVRIEKKPKPGQMGATNAMFRRELLQERPFDENYGAGGEDAEWSKWAINKGHIIVRDPGFTVFHSHGLGPVGWMHQYKEYWDVGKPRQFSREEIVYRRKEK